MPGIQTVHQLTALHISYRGFHSLLMEDPFILFMCTIWFSIDLVKRFVNLTEEHKKPLS